MGDFDFFVGHWQVDHRKLVAPLSGNAEWEQFTGTSRCLSVFDGAASFDEITLPNVGARGMTLRLYDPQRREWSLYWANSRTGRLDPPVVGRFADGRGEFYGDDTYDGRPVRVRYVWSDITPESARWEQAFSTDGEHTWETNWIMTFTRIPEA